MTVSFIEYAANHRAIEAAKTASQLHAIRNKIDRVLTSGGLETDIVNDPQLTKREVAILLICIEEMLR
jgi:copper homeostasis protein CutC